MCRKAILLLLVVIAVSIEVNAQGQTNFTKFDAWLLGTDLSLAGMQNAVGATPAKINESFGKAVQNSRKARFKLPPLPVKTKILKVNNQRYRDYVLNTGAAIEQHLKENFSEEHAAAFDIGLVTIFYNWIYIYGDKEQIELDSGQITAIIKSQTEIANLPAETTSEIVNLYGKNPSPEVVKKAVLATIANVSQYLMMRDETEIGDRLAKQGKYAEAIVKYTKIIEYDPNFPEAYYSRGAAYQKIGKENLAKLDFEKAESLEPGIVQRLSAKKLND